MGANQSISINLQFKTRLPASLCLVMAGLFILMSIAIRGRGSQGVSQIKLSVEDPRPVAEAILKLENKYGWVITYEDPRYVHDSEIADVTLRVSRDLDKYKPGEGPKVLIPRGGILEFTYDVTPNTNLPPDPAMVVQKLLSAQAASNNAGRFRSESSGKTMHVIPTAIKNSEGALVPQESVFDTIISLPVEERTGEQKLRSICAAISRATKIGVDLGTIPTNLFDQHRNRQGATSQRARDILVNMFGTMNNGTKLSWRLLYGPGLKRYVLNVHMVSKRDG